MKKRGKLFVVAAAILVVASLGYLVYRLLQEEPEGFIPVSGNIEATEAQVGFKVPGLIEERSVSEGQRVEKGALLARLDANDLRQEVRIRKADVELAKANLAELETGSRQQEIDAARATFERAQAEVAQQKRDWQRQRALREKNVIAEQEYEKALTAHEVAQARAREAKEQYELVKEGPRREKIQQARAKLAVAQERLSLAELNLEYAELHSPMAGIVLADHVEPGEYIVPGTGVVTLADLHEVWLRAYINETDLGRVKLGQPATVTTDSYPGKQYRGAVTFVASEAEFTPKTVQTEEQRVKLVYRIKIDLDNPHGELKPGMPADAKLILSERQP